MNKVNDRKILSKAGYSHQEITRFFKRRDLLEHINHSNFSSDLEIVLSKIIVDVFRVDLSKQLEIIRNGS